MSTTKSVRLKSRVGSVAIDFVNTVACPGCRGGDAFASVTEARSWMRARRLGDPAALDWVELSRLRRFRRELREVLQAATARTRPPMAAMASINRAAARSPTHTELVWENGRWKTFERSDARSASTWLTALTARSAVELFRRPHPPPVRRCQGPGCVHFLLARTSRQLWCSPSGCGNRVRVQRHYQKSRSLTGPGRSRRPAVRREARPRTRQRHMAAGASRDR